MTSTGPIDWQRIEEFIGYGSATAPYVFLGMEEGLRSEAALDAGLAVRSNYQPFEDLFEASRLSENERYFGDDPKNQPTWRPMCDLMLRLTEDVVAPTLPQRLRYMADKLGRSNGLTLLAELMPYPRKKADRKHWPYAKYERYADYEAYRADMLPKRLARLRSLFAMPCERRLIVAYGKGDWGAFKSLFDTAWRQVGRFETGLVGKTAVVLANQLATNAFNSDMDLDRFAAVVMEALL
jgi:hypothetical protein